MLEIEFPIYAVTDLFESKNIRSGLKREVPGGMTIELGPMPVQQRSPEFAYDVAPLLTLLVQTGNTVALDLFAAWLYDKLTAAKVRRVKINRRWVEVTQDGIYRAIEESIEIEEEK